jgi:hypothetical protein
VGAGARGAAMVAGWIGRTRSGCAGGAGRAASDRAVSGPHGLGIPTKLPCIPRNARASHSSAARLHPTYNARSRRRSGNPYVPDVVVQVQVLVEGTGLPLTEIAARTGWGPPPCTLGSTAGAGRGRPRPRAPPGRSGSSGPASRAGSATPWRGSRRSPRVSSRRSRSEGAGRPSSGS